MADHLTVAEVYRMQHRLIEMFGGLHGLRDKGAVEAAVFRPQTGCYSSIEEEAAALMESRWRASKLRVSLKLLLNRLIANWVYGGFLAAVLLPVPSTRFHVAVTCEA